MRFGQPADQALALTLGHRYSQPGRIRRRFARGQDNFGDAPAQEPTKVESRASAKLFKLECAELGKGLVLGELTGNQPA